MRLFPIRVRMNKNCICILILAVCECELLCVSRRRRDSNTRGALNTSFAAALLLRDQHQFALWRHDRRVFVIFNTGNGVTYGLVQHCK